MEGTDGFPRKAAYHYWATFDSTIRKRFLSSQEAQEARNEMDTLKYKGDISDYILNMRRLNNTVRMSGVTLRSTICRRLSEDMRRRLSMFREEYNDEDWLDLVVSVGKEEEGFLEEERLLKELRGGTENRKGGNFRTVQAKTDPAKASQWKAVKTDNASIPPDRFPRPVDFANLTETEKKQQDERLKGIPEDTIKARKAIRACIRCGQKGHVQYKCHASRPIISTVNLEVRPNNKRKVKEEEEEEPPKKRVAGLNTQRGRIYEITESEDEEMAG